MTKTEFELGAKVRHKSDELAPQMIVTETGEYPTCTWWDRASKKFETLQFSAIELEKISR